MITVTAFRWVPAFARGQVRDLRVRWALEEAGLDYEVRLIGPGDQASEAYRAMQPFGQVPAMIEGDLTLFESGAIVLDIAGRAPGLLPDDPGRRALAVAWLIASLNSVEPFLMNLAEVDFFTEDEAVKAARRPGVVAVLERRLADLQAALGDRDYLVDEFSAADLMMTTVLRIMGHTTILAAYPQLTAYRQRCEARPAFQRALAAQLGDFVADPPAS